MNTFLPYRYFYNCAECLDDKRLYKQVVECKQILNTLIRLRDEPTAKIAWRNHPAVLMWYGYGNALREYQWEMLREWIKRRWGFCVDDPTFDYLATAEDFGIITNYPAWLGDERVHSSHRSNLLRKNPEHYNKFGWTEPNDLPYFWPTKEGYQ